MQMKRQKNILAPFTGIIVIAIVAYLTVFSYAQSADQDRVQISIRDYNHAFYSGYLSINVIKNLRIHYVFFESQKDVNADPFVVWFSGAPGCSSMLGAFLENGPFVFKPTKDQFQINKYAWNKKANVLYLELPAGVGFSERKQQTQVTDQIFTNQAIIALKLFLSRFQRMKKHDLYLAGHGYAGTHIPKLARQMIDQNNDPFSMFNDKWMIKGILVGNPCTRPDECYATTSQKNSHYHYQFLYKRGFFSKKDYNMYLERCSFNFDDHFCFTQRKKLDKFFHDTNISAYNIYDKCYKQKNDTNESITDDLGYINTGCEDEAGIMNFWNNNDTKYYWNINYQSNKEWTPCNKQIHDDYLSSNHSYHLYPGLIQAHLRIWVYSGDIDSHIPITGTKKWINQLRADLQMPIRKNWREWWVPGRHPGEDQVGGLVWDLEGLTFASVKGAGFRSGIDQPQAMEEILTAFLTGKQLPYQN